MFPLGKTSRKTFTSYRVFDKILIANRGEIAVRIIKTAKGMGIKCVAVCSEADKNSKHSLMADEAVVIGAAPSSESYLNIESILAAMKQTGVQAVHPGYGFLSENYKFAEELDKLKLIFIGPPASAIKSMGSKSESKGIMEKAGVPCIPGYYGNNQDPTFLAQKAQEIGYPIMIKAVLGGGGKGMKVARNANEFPEMLQSAKRESLKAFHDDRVLLEKFIENSRHIEVQILADKYGHCIYLFERDCSIQRRNQKVIEEAPASDLSCETRTWLGETAVAAAKAVNYVGPGTVEFIYDCLTGSFYFMEMNTRLQVEHPVTEMITGLDLVEWQIKIASGQPLDIKQQDLNISGHSIEARIYAEDPMNNFLPDTGKLVHCKLPANRDWLRVETGVQEGDDITIYYDPMIAKVVVKGSDRRESIKRLDWALSELHVVGVHTNIDFLRRILAHGDFFNQQQIETGFITKNRDYLLQQNAPVPSHIKVIGALISLCQKGIFSINNELSFFRIVGTSHVNVGFKEGLVKLTLTGEKKMRACVDGLDFAVELIRHEGNQLWAQMGNRIYSTMFFNDARDSTVHLWTLEGHFQLHESGEGSNNGRDVSKLPGTGQITTVMPCRIGQVCIKVGEKVTFGTTLAITESMKMEQIVKSDVEGTVEKIYCTVGQIVPAKTLIMSIKPTKS